MLCPQEPVQSSNSLTVHVLRGTMDFPVCVEADLELEDLLTKVRTELRLSGEAELEQYEEDLDKWMTVTDTDDLELKAGAKYRVKSNNMPKAVSTVNTLQSGHPLDKKVWFAAVHMHACVIVCRQDSWHAVHGCMH